MATYTKVTPVSAFASSSYITYTPDKLIDGDLTTSGIWYSLPKANGGVSQTQFIGLKFNSPTAVRKIVVRLYIWSYDLVIGYSSSQPGSQAAVTRLRTLDFKTKTTDDLGVTIAFNTDLTFFVPDFPSSSYLVLHPLTTATGAIGNGQATSDFLAAVELSAYTEDAVVVPPKSYTKESGVPTAISQAVVAGYPVSQIADGLTTTTWISDESAAAVSNTAVGYNLPVPKAVTKIEVNFFSWPTLFAVVYADTFPSAVSGFKTARVIGINATPNDDLGVPWRDGRQGANTIILDGNVTARAWAIQPLQAVTKSAIALNESARAAIYEMALFTNAPLPVVEIKGTAFCDKGVALSGQPASLINDGNTNTMWYGSKYGDTAQSLSNFCGIKFAKLQDVSHVLATIHVWGSTVKIGTWAANADPASASFTLANIIPISSCNILVDKDVDGKAIVSRTLPYKYNATAKSIPGILVYCDDNRTSELGNFGVGGAANNALVLRELQIFGTDATVVQPPALVDGLNPRPPATVPVSPFTAQVGNWVRTEYATAGDFNFVPDPTASLLFVAIQGAGAGGSVNRNMDNSIPTLGPSLHGGETYVAVSDGEVWSVQGGQKSVPGTQDILQEGHADWVRTPGVISVASATFADGVPNAVAGTATAIGTAGAPYALALTAELGQTLGVNFLLGNGVAQGWVPAAISQFQWAQGYGWQNTNHAHNSTGYVQFNPFTLKTGQTVTFFYNIQSEPGHDQLYIFINGAQFFKSTATTTGASVTYTVPSNGNYTFQFQYTKDVSVHTGTDTANVTSVEIDGRSMQTPSTTGGAGGRAVTGFLLPTPLQLRVGAGGVGVTGGQTVPVAAHGKRGGGGAGGGNGGDGVIVVYEYKLQLPFETPKLPDMSAYNNATPELPGIYRTNYIGIGSNTKQNYVHKLRPRTKRVLVLMVGAGGGSCHWTDISRTVYNSGPAIVSTGTKTLTAESGSSSYKSDINTYVGGSAGAFTSDVEAIYSKDGLPGGWFGGNSNTGRVTEFYGNYGNSSAGWPYSSSSSGPLITASGGSGALALAVLTESMLQSRELAIQVPGIGRGDYQAGTAGAVIIFETESVFDDVFTSQVSELVLQRGAPYANTQVSQVNELVLQRDALAPNTQVSQVVLMVLQRTPTVVGTSVTEQTIEIIGKAEPSNVRVSQSIQSVLVESEPPSQNVSQVAALVLIKENPTLLQMMDFGVMRFPMKNTLYLSDICTVVGIGSGKSLRFQLEGDLPAGSTIIYNGVDIRSLTVMIKDGDTLQLKSGVTNWFVTTMYVFVYVSRADQIVREYAGFWSVLQATLAGRKRATIGALSSKRTVILAKTGSAIGVKKAIAARSAKESKAQMTARRAIENVVKATVTSKVAKGNAVSSPTKTMDRTVGEAVLSTPQTFDHVIGKDALSNTSTFRIEQKPKAANFNMYMGVYASGNTVKSKAHQFTNTYGEAVLSKAQKFSPRNGSPLIRFGMQSIPRNNSTIVLTDVFYNVAKKGVAKTHSDYNSIGASGYRPADQHFVVFNYSKSASLKVVTFLGNSQQAGSFFRPGYVYTPAFVATNSPTIGFTIQENDKVVFVDQQYVEGGKYKYAFRDHGYFWRASPNRDVGATIQAVAAVSVNRVYWGGLGWAGRHPPAYIGVEREYTVRESNRATGAKQEFVRREFNRANGAEQSYAVRINNSNLIHVQYSIRKTNILLYGMRPMLYQAGKNRIDKAKYYMGFTTQAEVNAFIVNFLKPTTKLKLDGYVYRVGIDETLVCEIRGPNMPLAWLMRGG